MNLPTRQSDPSAFWGSIVAVIGAAVALLTAFGVPLTEPQTVAILGLATALGPIVTQWLIRQDAYSPLSHFREVRQVETMTAEDGAADLSAIAWLLVIVLLVLVIVRTI